MRYSEGNENCLDLVFFLNGLPVATVELKSDFTQSVKDAVDQYRFDRHPQPKGQKAEPLLSFPGGALVHFAVSNSEAQMTTRLAGPATRFLPFNKGDHGAAGNPPSPSGHRTSYLWEEVWERESFLDILGRYLVTEKDDKKKLTRYLFPRYHQLDATRKLLNAVKAEGAGGKYLIQHSAGSGKTNSIAWTAHFFSWEKATAAHVYCLQGEKGISTRFSRDFHDLVRPEETGHLAEALVAHDVAEAVAIHKNAFFAEKDASGNRINYLEAVRNGLTLVPSRAGYEALRQDYQRMVMEGLLYGSVETFE